MFLIAWIPALFTMISSALAGLSIWGWTWLLTVLPFLISKIFGFIGIGLLAYVGLDIAIDAIETAIFAQFDNIGTDLLSILKIMGLLTGVKIMFGAMSGVIALKIAAQFRKVVFKSGGSLTA
jgi:Flp pilus assembly pilin Flp